MYHLGTSNQYADSLFRFPVSLVGRQSVMTTQQIATAQEQDPVPSTIQAHLQTNPQAAPSLLKWKKFSLRRYKQLL